MTQSETFTDAYLSELRAVFCAPQYECAPRGQLIRETLHRSFRVSDPRHRLPFVDGRGYSPSYMAAECLWYFAALKSVEWIAPYAPFWSSISDDGVTVNSAYGARVFTAAPDVGIAASQWEWIKSELRRDPDSRRAFLHIRMPRDSFEAKLDVPCTIGLQFFIRAGKLHMIAIMRSSDLVLGLANDVPAFTLFQELMALELGIELGEYMHTSGSAHVYQRDFQRVEKMLEAASTAAPASHAMPRMPAPPPVIEMLAAESRLRSASTFSDVRDAVSAASGVMDAYWLDFIKLLAAFWMKKAGAKDEAKSYVKSECSWEHWSARAFR